MNKPVRGGEDWRRRALRVAAALMLGLLFAAPSLAQTANNNFSAFSQNSGEPINIESDVLVVHDAKKYATFKGDVKAVQGTTTLRAAELDVHYVGGGGDSLTGGTSGGEAKPSAAGGGGLGAGNGNQISRIEARGSVVITSDKDQTTTSDWALYDVPTQIVTVGGNVVLMQGKNMLKGDRLVIDLKTGESRFENQDRTVAGGRIRALFMPKEGEGKPGAETKKDGKPDASRSNPAASEPAPSGEGDAEGAAKKAERAPDDDTGEDWNPLSIQPR